MCDVPPFDAAKCRLGGNQDSDAEVFFRLNYDRIVHLLRKQINRRYQAKVDAEDIANSVMKTFFRRYVVNRLNLSDWQGLWKLLTEIALNKLRNRIRSLNQQKRDIRREVSGHDLGMTLASDESEPTTRLPHDDPQAEAMIRDLYTYLTRGCCDEELRIVEMILQGYQLDEIGEELCLSKRTVQRIRERFRKRLEAERDLSDL